MERVIIVGGGVSGLVANYVFRKHGQRPIVLEPRAPGGDFLFGGLKYITKTQAMSDMFDDIELAWSDYKIQGGILLQGEVHPYPKHLATLDEDAARRIQEDHFRKTRRTEPGTFGGKAMNDPAGEATRRAIRCNFHDMINRLAALADIQKLGIQAINGDLGKIQLTDGEWTWYDKLILTIPLWVIRQMSDFYVPQGMAMSLNLVQVRPFKDRYARWDYVYTPYTPADAVHRFSPKDAGYSVEVNGDWKSKESATLNDLAFIFGDGFLVEGVKAGVKGHLLELQEQPKWPEDVVPLGRFAQWDPRATTDKTLENAHALAEAWGWPKTE